jgi:hypothetical protein
MMNADTRMGNIIRIGGPRRVSCCPEGRGVSGVNSVPVSVFCLMSYARTLIHRVTHFKVNVYIRVGVGVQTVIDPVEYSVVYTLCEYHLTCTSKKYLYAEEWKAKSDGSEIFSGGGFKRFLVT